jgi:hypothetical protein
MALTPTIAKAAEADKFTGRKLQGRNSTDPVLLASVLRVSALSCQRALSRLLDTFAQASV